MAALLTPTCCTCFVPGLCPQLFVSITAQAGGSLSDSCLQMKTLSFRDAK